MFFNHFSTRYCSDICRVPTLLYLTDYESSASTLGHSSRKQNLELSPVSALPQKISRNNNCRTNMNDHSTRIAPPLNSHHYETTPPPLSSNYIYKLQKQKLNCTNLYWKMSRSEHQDFHTMT